MFDVSLSRARSAAGDSLFAPGRLQALPARSVSPWVPTPRRNSKRRKKAIWSC